MQTPLCLTVLEAATHIKQGDVLAYATESVWGLGCDPYNKQAVERLLALKQRSVDKGLILVAANIAQIEHLLQPLNATEKARVLASWPSATTWLLPLTTSTPLWISGQFDRVAVRVTNHPDIQALCVAVGSPVVSTSANPAGFEAARSLAEAYAYFDDNILYMTSQSGGNAQPSVIRDSISNQIIRG